MSVWRKRDFEQACKWGTDEEIREVARELRDRSYGMEREEIRDFMIQTLKREKPFETSSWNSDVTYDGIHIKKFGLPKIEVEEG